MQGTTRTRYVVALVAAALTITACPGTEGSDTTGDTSTATTSTGGADTTATDGDADTTSDGDATTDTTSDGDAAAPTVALAEIVTCHEESEAGGNSDIHVVIDVTGDVDTVMVTATSSEQGEITGSGAVVDGRAVVRLPAVAFGESVTIDAVTAGSADTSALVGESHTVPDGGGGSCEYSAAAEASAS